MRAGNRDSERRQTLRERRRIPGETDHQNEIDRQGDPTQNFKPWKGTLAAGFHFTSA
jgi:hypothetical protein